jgi:hypothetical protein
VWRSSTGASGLPRRCSGGLRWCPSQICRTWLPPQKLSSPSQSLYMEMGMVMMPKKGVPRDVQWAGSRGQQTRQRPSLQPSGSAFRRCEKRHARAAFSCSISLTTRTGPRPACAGRSPHAGALAVNAAPGYLPGQHFPHYFSEEVPRGERDIHTSENTPSTHSGEEGSSVSLVHAHEIVCGGRRKLRVVG